MANDQPPAPPQAPEDEDEFAGVPDPPLRRNPITALIVIALAGLVVWHLRADIRYAFRGQQPEALGDARTLAGRGIALEDNEFVDLRGQPDRRNALFIEPRGEKTRQTFFRLLGTHARLLVRAADTAKQPKLEDRWVGRLRRFDTLPYAAPMRDYYAHEVSAARFFTPDMLRALVQKPGDPSVHDRAGEPLALAPDSMIAIDVLYPDELVALLSREKFASLADATHEIEQLGLLGPCPQGRVGCSVVGGAETPEQYRVFVRAPAAERNAIIGKLDAAEFAFAMHQEQISAKLGELTLDGDTLRAGKRVLPWAGIKAASVAEPIVIAPDAYVLAEGEAPGSFWWAPVVAALLLAFAAFNVWYLFRRRDSTPRQPAAKKG